MSSAPGDGASWLALSAWVRARGGFLVEGLCEGPSPETKVRGLVASDALNEGETVMHVPLACFITNSKFKAQLEAIPGQFTLIDDTALALALIDAQSAGTHGPYVDSLPTSADFAACLPSWWPAEERASLLHGSPLLEEVEAHVSSFDLDWNLLQDSRTALGVPQLTKDAFQWALAVVTSRAFTMDSGTSCLIPGMDIMNHRRPRVTSYTISEDANDNGVTVVALQTIGIGAEVTITYGAKSNSHLLRNYGFTVAANTEADGSSNDLCRVQFSLDSQPSRKRKASGAEAAGNAVDEEVHALRLERWKAFKASDDDDEDASQHDKTSARWVDLRLTSSTAPKHYTFGAFTKCLDASRVLSLTTATVGSAGKKLEPRHTRSEVAALEYLAAHLQELEARYENPPAASSPISSDDARHVNCTRVISSERQMLQFYTKVATTAATILRHETSSPRGDQSWKTAALETLEAADATAPPGALEGSLSSPLCAVSRLVRTYLQIKFGAKL
jgi:hypothetical protein